MTDKYQRLRDALAKDAEALGVDVERTKERSE